MEIVHVDVDAPNCTGHPHSQLGLQVWVETLCVLPQRTELLLQVLDPTGLEESESVKQNLLTVCKTVKKNIIKTIRTAVFWDVTMGGLVVDCYRGFEGIWSLHHCGEEWTQKMETGCSCELFVSIQQITWYHILEHLGLDT
jgi:hypothetical protein